MESYTAASQYVRPVVLSKEDIDHLPIEGFPEPGRIVGSFQNVFASETTPTNELTFGVATFPAKTTDKTSYEALHRHEPAEFYYILSGYMILLLEGVKHKITAGHAVYIPGNAEHGFCNPSHNADLLFCWGFATDGFQGIRYDWSQEQPDCSLME
jgi:mannose-6-phosphate isomerase-like protein (cupin superfamily)